jgi:dGTPase
LDEIMGGEIDIGGKLKYKLNFGGFKHNYNSVKVLDEIEIKYPYPVKGLNLTWQVKDGILKHTKIVRHKKKSECDLLHERKMCSRSRETCFDITRFMQRPELFKECLKYENPCTLEGQVVAIADEIAQRQHDLDDGLRDKLLELNVDTISDKLIEDITKITQGKDEVLDEIKLLNNLRKKINNKKKKTSERLYRQNSLVRDVINYFILDVTIHSIENINNKGEASIKKVGDRAYITDELISFSDTGKAFNKELEIFITNKIINSETVNKFDGKSLYIVRQLYKAYYTNPRQMPKYVLDRLLASLADNSKSIYPIQFKDEDKPYDYSKKFENGTRDDVSRLISLLKLELDVNKLICPIESEFLRLYCDMENGEYSFKVSELVAVNKTTVNVIKEIRPESEKMHKLFIKCLLENHYVYMATICDFISGMTDNYAIDQYESLYLV